MMPLFIILYIIVMVVAAACYLIGYSHASAERRARRSTIPQTDWRYDLEGTWQDYQPSEKPRHRVSHDAALDDTTIN